jgi:hypothetical protein
MVKFFKQGVVDEAHKAGVINDLDLDFQKNARIHNRFHGGVTEKQTPALRVQYGLIKRWLEDNEVNPQDWIDPTPITIKPTPSTTPSVPSPTITPAQTLSRVLGGLKGYNIIPETKFNEKKLEKVIAAAEVVKEVKKTRKLIRTVHFYDDGTYADAFMEPIFQIVSSPVPTPEKRKEKSETDKLRCRGAAVVYKGKVYKSISAAGREMDLNRHWIREACDKNINGWRYA